MLPWLHIIGVLYPLMRSVSATTASAPFEILVKGAGTLGVNGVYSQVSSSSGENSRGGVVVYAKVPQKDWLITYYSHGLDRLGAAWYIEEEAGNKAAYWINSEQAPDMSNVKVPMSGWAVYDGETSLPGNEPAPSIHLAMQEFLSTVVDDISAVASGTWLRETSTGSLGCGHQGWKDSFLFLEDDASGSSSVTFRFEPEVDGCYLIEEFHPVDTCQRRMSMQIEWAVHHGRGLVKHLTGSWTRGAQGNRWNMISRFHFYKDYAGKVVVKRQRGSTGWTVADAFRFTLVAETCEEVANLFGNYSSLADHPVSVTLDDRVAAKSGKNLPDMCRSTALLGSAHVSSQADAKAEFQFIPPSTGCYRLDEWHPEIEQTECELVESGASIHVDHLAGHWQSVVALSTDGSQWNSVGHFPFAAGVPAKVISTPSTSFRGKYWVADAFRFTRVSDSCSAVPYSALLTLRIVGAELPVEEDLVGLTSYGDLRLALQRELATFAGAGVEGLRKPMIRLLGLRRGSIIAEFEMRTWQGSIIMNVTHFFDRLHADLNLGFTQSVLGSRLCRAAGVGDECYVQVLRAQKKTKYEDYHNTTNILKEEDHIFGGFNMTTIGLASILLPVCCMTVCAIACRMVRAPKKEQPFHKDNFSCVDLELNHAQARADFDEDVRRGESAQVEAKSRVLQGAWNRALAFKNRDAEKMSNASGSTTAPVAVSDDNSSTASGGTWEQAGSGATLGKSSLEAAVMSDRFPNDRHLAVSGSRDKVEDELSKLCQALSSCQETEEEDEDESSDQEDNEDKDESSDQEEEEESESSDHESDSKSSDASLDSASHDSARSDEASQNSTDLTNESCQHAPSDTDDLLRCLSAEVLRASAHSSSEAAPIGVLSRWPTALGRSTSGVMAENAQELRLPRRPGG